MCNVAAALNAFAAAGTLAGMSVSMHAAREQGKFQKDMMDYQAGLERQRASLAEKNAEIQAGRLRQQRRMETAAGMAEFAAHGMLLDGDPESAPTVWEQDMAAETAWRVEELRDQAMYEAWGFNTNASMLAAQGRMARRDDGDVGRRALRCRRRRAWPRWAEAYKSGGGGGGGGSLLACMRED